MAVFGCCTSTLPTGSVLESVSIVTRFGSKPASRSTRRKARTECAIGSTEVGCGLTMTALPVARLAIIDGQAFQVAKVAQVKHTATPRGVARQVLSSAMRALPKLRSQRLRGVTARRACRAWTRASIARSSAFTPLPA